MKKRTYILACLILLVTAAISLLAGNGSISSSEVFDCLIGGGTALQKVIVFRIRIPRIVAATASGAALSVSGYLLQKDLNNSLASPGILGINNGAGLFVLLYACIFPYRYGGKCLAAFLGALLVTSAIYALASGTGMSKTSVVLSGVAVSAFCLSLIDIIISLKPETVADRAAFQLGGFATLSPASVVFAVPVIAVVLILSWLFAPSLDILIMGDETAGGLGVNVKRYRGAFIFFAAILSGAAVSMCGIIGFLGLIVSNVLKLFYRGNGRGGILLCAVSGSVFLMICDLLGRNLVFPYEIPCGLFLSITGAPFMIWMLIKKRKRLGA
ncbi:MAG: iron ABC transporter permease [Lachnospiraceae bacterium]|nr:iron ABC transporter permease [Lachnospiraceae bacterium]